MLINTTKHIWRCINVAAHSSGSAHENVFSLREDRQRSQLTAGTSMFQSQWPIAPPYIVQSVRRNHRKTHNNKINNKKTRNINKCALFISDLALQRVARLMRMGAENIDEILVLGNVFTPLFRHSHSSSRFEFVLMLVQCTRSIALPAHKLITNKWNRLYSRSSRILFSAVFSISMTEFVNNCFLISSHLQRSTAA